MNIIILAAVFAVLFIVKRAFAGAVVTPEEAARRLAAGAAVLIDVREPAEWTGGVVKGALLLPLGDLRGGRKLWKPALEANRDKELILYCASGIRSGMAARILAAEKFKTVNAGGFASWKQTGQPVVTP